MISLISPAPFAPPRPCSDTLTIAPHSTIPRIAPHCTITRIARTATRITTRITARIVAHATRAIIAALAAGVSPPVTSSHSTATSPHSISYRSQDVPSDTHLFRVRICRETTRDRRPLHS